MYPDANIWLIGRSTFLLSTTPFLIHVAGHSLGGSLSSLIGATFGVPVVAFEAPGEKLAASRLHLPSPVHSMHTLNEVTLT